MENLESSLAMTWYDYRKSSWAMLTLALPLMSGFFLQYAQGFIGLLFMGRLGSTELASATLAMSFFNNTAFTIVAGLLSGMETIGSQALGALHSEKFVFVCQKGALITSLVPIPLGFLWWYSGELFNLIMSDKELASMAGKCMKDVIPGLFGVALFEWGKRYLQTQQIGSPVFWSSGIATASSALLYWGLIHKAGLGVYGGMLSFGLLYVFNACILMAFIIRRNYTSKYQHMGQDLDEFVRLKWLSKKSFFGWGAYFKVALPSTATLFLEYWAWQFVNLLAPMLPNADHETAAFGIAFEMCYIGVLLPLGVGQATCVLVATAIGEHNALRARRIMKLGYALTFVLSLSASATVYALRHEIPKLFTDDVDVHHATTRALRVSSAMMMFDAGNQIGAGVFRACNWQRVTAYLTLVHYLVGIPVAWFVGMKMTHSAAGLFVGLLVSTSITAVTQLVIAMFVIDFQKAIDEMQENLLEGDEGDYNEGTELLGPPQLTSSSPSSFFMRDTEPASALNSLKSYLKAERRPVMSQERYRPNYDIVPPASSYGAFGSGADSYGAFGSIDDGGERARRSALGLFSI